MKLFYVQIYIPAHCQVGQWYCTIETAFKDMPRSRWQYRCPEAMYIIFNPFCPGMYIIILGII